MKDFYERQAINIVRQMIRAFYVEKNVDKVLSFMNPEKFMCIGSAESLVLTDFDEIKNFFKSKCKVVIDTYKIIDEDYFISASSADSCVVFAKVTFKGVGVREGYFPKLHFSFYLQLIGGKLLVSHYHVHSPIKNTQTKMAESLFTDKIFNSFISNVDFAYQNEILYNFFNSTGIALKVFFYEENFPYCCGNKAFLNLVGLKKISDLENNLSSLIHIHPNDQQNYIARLESFFAEKLNTLDFSGEWQWKASYYLSYRLQTFDKAEKFVFEWGNLFTLNGRPIVNSCILPINEKWNNYSPLPNFFSDCGENFFNRESSSSLLNDFGVHIGDKIVIYPKYRKILVKNKPLELTALEFKLMLILAENVNAPVSAEILYRILWHDGELKFTSSALKMHISNLRRKLKKISDNEINLTYVRNEGYCLKIPQF